MEQRQDEWLACMAAAEGELTSPVGEPRAEGGSRQRVSEDLRLWRWPSFEPWETWVFVNRYDGRTGESRTIVRRLRWRNDLDGSRLQSPMEGLKLGFHATPTIEVEETELDRGDWARPRRELEGVGLATLALSKVVAIDGTRFGVSIPNRLRLEWTSTPDGWEHLVRWVDSTQAWLDSLSFAPAPTRPTTR